MFTFLIVLIILVALMLCVVILIQSGKGGGLAASFGGASSSTDSFMGGRQAASVLTKTTWIGGAIYMALALVLAIMSSRSGGTPQSILQEGLGAPTQVEAPASVLDTEGQPGEAAGQPEGGGEAEGEGDGGTGGGDPEDGSGS
jgi:preprotein translocase subunit SecG